MPTFTLRNAWICSGGNHYHVEVSDGVKTRKLEVDTAFLRSPVTEEEIQVAFKIITRAAIRGLTPAQAKSKLDTGFSVVID
jgi:hypothetical protein